MLMVIPALLSIGGLVLIGVVEWCLHMKWLIEGDKNVKILRKVGISLMCISVIYPIYIIILVVLFLRGIDGLVISGLGNIG